MFGKGVKEVEQQLEAKKSGSPDFRVLLAEAPSVHEVLARPAVYEVWLKKAQEALNA